MLITTKVIDSRKTKFHFFISEASPDSLKNKKVRQQGNIQGRLITIQGRVVNHPYPEEYPKIPDHHAILEPSHS